MNVWQERKIEPRLSQSLLPKYNTYTNEHRWAERCWQDITVKIIVIITSNYNVKLFEHLLFKYSANNS